MGGATAAPAATTMSDGYTDEEANMQRQIDWHARQAKGPKREATEDAIEAPIKIEKAVSRERVPAIPGKSPPPPFRCRETFDEATGSEDVSEPEIVSKQNAGSQPPATEEGITACESIRADKGKGKKDHSSGSVDKDQGKGNENPGGEPFAVCADCGSKFSGAHGVLRCEEGCGKAYCKACARFDRSPCGTGQVPEPPHIFDQLMHRDRDRARAGESTGAMPPHGDSGETRSVQTSCPGPGAESE